nr:hypothetical protein HK105_006902 [Polyrhizophydium stewartii]
MIEVICNDRLGKKVRVKCNPDDTIGVLKLLVAAQTGTKAEKIVLKKWYTIYKDHITLEDYEIHDGMSLEMWVNVPDAEMQRERGNLADARVAIAARLARIIANMSSAQAPHARIRVGVLGATGMVGQRFIQLLAAHPQFELVAVGASERSAGKRYGDAATWRLDTPMPAAAAALPVRACDPAGWADAGVRVVFSALDAAAAGPAELAFARAGAAVFSNAKNYRMHPRVPLVVPLANADHLAAIALQRSAAVAPAVVADPAPIDLAADITLPPGAALVANANCSTTGLVVALRPLVDAFGPLSRVAVVTMQAVSGAGYPGVPSLDILGNVVPFISGEEEKLEEEAAKILGGVDVGVAAGSLFTPAPALRVSASCNRVAVIDGHTESVFVEFARRPPPSIDEIKHALGSYVSEAQRLGVHSAPAQAIVVTETKDRPQPRLDVNTGAGFSVVVGRVRPCNLFDVKFTLLSHNTVLGAAGSSIMNAEIALAKGLL